MTTLNGREGISSSADMAPSSSASQSENADEHQGDSSGDGVERSKDGGGDVRPIMAILLSLVPFPSHLAPSLFLVLTLGLKECRTAVSDRASLLEQQ